MTLIVSNAAQIITLERFLTGNLTLKLYSNNRVPAKTDTAASYTAVAGGGYANKTLAYASWTIAAGASNFPAVATYAAQDFTFTGVTTAPGTIYGYYIVDSDGVLRWAERFLEDVVPFEPVNGSLIRINPRMQVN